MADVSDLEQAVSYTFQRKIWAEEALTHASLVNERGGAGRPSNTRLAFLGDSVLLLAVRDALLRESPDLGKGTLTVRTHELVNNEALAPIVLRKGLGGLVDRGNGQPLEADTVLIRAQLLEAIFGAIYLDVGYPAAASVVIALLQPTRVGGRK